MSQVGHNALAIRPGHAMTNTGTLLRGRPAGSNNLFVAWKTLTHGDNPACPPDRPGAGLEPRRPVHPSRGRDARCPGEAEDTNRPVTCSSVTRDSTAEPAAKKADRAGGDVRPTLPRVPSAGGARARKRPPAVVRHRQGPLATGAPHHHVDGAPLRETGSSLFVTTPRYASDMSAVPRSEKPAGRFRRMLDRLSSSQGDLESEELREDAETAGCTRIGDCQDRQIVTVTGTLRTVTLRPRAGVPALEAELFDGSAPLDVVWLGRRSIVGIEPGRRLIASGRISMSRGRRVLFNPKYELRPLGRE